MIKAMVRLLVVALVVMVGVATAGDNELTRRSLKGLKWVFVAVEGLEAEVEQNGLTKIAIQTDVELKLRQAGICVLGNEGRTRRCRWSDAQVSGRVSERRPRHQCSD
jgi:hypothetical protein